MAKKKKQDEESGGNWMDTYGDMVTLLLTFFIMLYSMSSIQEDKWAQLVKAFNTEGKTKVDQIVLTIDGKGDQPSQNKGEEKPTGDGLTQFDKFYTDIQEYLEENNMATNNTIERGEDTDNDISNGTNKDNIYISFQDSITFAPDTAVLLESSYPFLDFFGQKLQEINNEVAVILIKGHTAVADSSDVDSRILSAERASTIANYLEQKFGISAVKLIPIGHANLYPVADNSTEEGRSQNRRVEISILGKNSPLIKNDLLKSLISVDYDVSTALENVE